MIALRVTRRNGATEADGTALALPPHGLVIGRSEHCGLVLADPLRLVSREHAHVIQVDGTVQVRCLSSNARLWLNDVLLDPGCQRALVVGDRLRMGRFELAVEPVAATAARRPRLERWFDLDGAPDPLADGSPLPTLGPAFRAVATGTFHPRNATASAVTPRSLCPEETRIAPRGHMPLKFAPGATEALARMVRPEAG